MGEGEEKRLQAPCFISSQHGNNNHAKHKDEEWVMMIMEGGDHDDDISNTSSSFNDNSSNGSVSSSSGHDAVDDDASSSSTNSNGALFELSELMAHLPIKRGLSKYYQGKSQSFTSLSRVINTEDLPKKEIPYRKKMFKSCKSYGNGLDAHKLYTLPKPIISKKVSRSCLSSLSFPVRRAGSFLNSSNRPPPVQKKF